MKVSLPSAVVAFCVGVMVSCKSTRVTEPTGTAAAPDSDAAESAEATAAQPVKPIRHAAVGAGITASSTHREWPVEGTPASLVDGRLDTRWSSDYSEPQDVVVDLGKTIAIDLLRLHWEAAFATHYTVFLSTDGKHWTKAQSCLRTKDDTEAGVDNVSLNGLEARYIRIDLQKRLNPEWGFSLWEIEVMTK